MTESTQKRKKSFLISIIVLNIVLAFAAGYIVATYKGVQNILLTPNGQVDITKVTDLYGKSRSESISFNQFWDVWNEIKSQYVEQPVDDVKLFYGALEGMVAGLGDPYSVYFPPEQAKEFTTELSGKFEGIGAEIGKKDEYLVVIAPLPKSPAELAGLRPGDRIFAINGESTLDMSTDVAVSKIRGAKGTIVTLSLAHEKSDDLLELKITRQVIDIPTITWEMKEKNIAYLRVSVFNQDTWSDFDSALSEILKAKAQGLVLDLRNNPGGYLETAVQMASEWIPDGVVVRERFSSGKVQEYPTKGLHRLVDMPTVVLVNQGSASASEILSGALQDYKKAKLIGQKTFGKGSVQSFQILPDGSALKVTIAKWFTPLERQIDEKGIEPDIALPDPLLSSTSTPRTKPEDAALRKALDILIKK